MERKGNALVTGAACRIGLRIADRLARAGYDLVLHASPRSTAAAEHEARRLSDAHGLRAVVVTADLGEAEACRRLIGQSSALLGPLRLLVNNATLFEADNPDALDAALWERQFAVNLRAPVLLAHAFASQAGDGDDAAIVNVIDRRTLRPRLRFLSDTLTKSALWTATQTMAQAFAERGVRVNGVGPGPVPPNATDEDSKEIASMPLHRAVDPDEIAAAVLYLAEARAVTGQMITVDAGRDPGQDVVE